jgi:hypothetical protein
MPPQDGNGKKPTDRSGDENDVRREGPAPAVFLDGLDLVALHHLPVLVRPEHLIVNGHSNALPTALIAATSI